jgi:CRISPR/Cas system CMR-associated protein Cmr1 (group 7 of RAMP superfamily)
VYQQNRNAILPGATFGLRLQCRPLEFEPVEVAGRRIELEGCFELAAASFWLLLRLGGVGARGRRGGGSIQAQRDPPGWPESLPSLVCQAQTPAALATELSAGLQQLRRVTGWQTAASPTVSSFDILHPAVSQLVVLDRTFPSWWEALDWVGQRFQTFRHDQKEDAGAIAGLLTQGRLLVRTIQRAVLGLPIPFFFKSILADLKTQGVPEKDARRRASASVMPEKGLGRTSPLFLRVVRLAGDTPAYTVVMGLFRAELLPGGKLRVQPQDRALRPASATVASDFSLLDQWFAYIAQEAGRLHPVPL